MTRDRDEFDGGEGSASDRLSSPAPIERRAVHPYRGRRDALIARRRAIAQQLEAAERAARRRDRLARELARIDAELHDQDPSPADAISIPTPCRARWDDMEGDGAVRRCRRCDRHVHDLAQLTRAEIEALLARTSGPGCVRLRRRPDGRVVTGDCPAPRPHPALRALGAVAAGAVLGAGAAGAVALASMPARAPSPLAPLPAVAPPAAATIDVGALRSTPEEDEAAVTMGEPAWPAPAEAPIERAELDRHVRWIAPQAWEVDRALLERALALESIDPGARVIPYSRGGRPAGVRVYGVRRESLLGRLGLQNGDAIVEINGRALRTPDDLAALALHLEGADAYFVRIRRRGEERVHVYRVVG